MNETVMTRKTVMDPCPYCGARPGETCDRYNYDHPGHPKERGAEVAQRDTLPAASQAVSGPIAGHELLVKRLIAEGIIPRLCRRATFNFAVNQVATMTLEVLVTKEQMQKIADALADNPEEAKALAREILFIDLAGKREAKVSLP